MYYNFYMLTFNGYLRFFFFALTIMFSVAFSFIAFSDVYMVNRYTANVYEAPSIHSDTIITYFNRTLVYTVPATQQDYASLRKAYPKLKYESYTDFVTNDKIDWVKIQLDNGRIGWIAKNSVSYISSDVKKDKDIVWGEPNPEQMNRDYADAQGGGRGSGYNGLGGANTGQTGINVKSSDIGNNHYNEKLSPLENFVDRVSIYNIRSVKSDKVDFFSEYIAQIIVSTLALIAIILALDYFKFYNILIHVNWYTRIADFLAGSMLVAGVAIGLANGFTFIPVLLMLLSVFVFFVSTTLTNNSNMIFPAFISKPILWFGLISILYISLPLILVFGLLYYVVKKLTKH